MLRQRTWAIFIRSYYLTSGARLYDGGDRIYGSYPVVGGGVPGRGNGEGGFDGTAKMKTGSWTMWYTGDSFKKVRQKYKELLDVTPKEYIMVTEIIPADTLVTPLT